MRVRVGQQLTVLLRTPITQMIFFNQEYYYGKEKTSLGCHTNQSLCVPVKATNKEGENKKNNYGMDANLSHKHDLQEMEIYTCICQHFFFYLICSCCDFHINLDKKFRKFWGTKNKNWTSSHLLLFLSMTIVAKQKKLVAFAQFWALQL